jgi:hypothetical protein
VELFFSNTLHSVAYGVVSRDVAHCALHILVSLSATPSPPPLLLGGGVCSTACGFALPLNSVVTSRNNGIPVSIREVDNLNRCVYYLKHMERVQRQPIANAINLVLVRSYRNQQRHEVGFNKTSEEPDINDKNWPRTLEKIKEYLSSKYVVTGDKLDFVVRPDIAVKPEA